MKYIVGLGNPGPKYARTKHNIGFNVVKSIAKEAEIKIEQRLYSSLLGRGSIGGVDVTLVLPETYMNLAGRAVRGLYSKEMKRMEDLVVICDDVNLGLGRIRIRKKGSSGGHKGLESIIDALGRDDFLRLRVGVGPERSRKGDITDYVLSPFKREHFNAVSHAVSLAKEACISLIEDGVEAAMRKFNARRPGLNSTA